VGAGDDSALRGLTEDFSQPHNRHGAGHDHVGQDLTGPDRGKLIDVADDYQRRMVGDRPQQCLHQQDIDHRGFVDDQQVALEWVVATAFETAALGIDLEQSVNGLGSKASGFRHPLGGAASRRTKQ
jgi:hypothetical protein